MTPWRYYRTLTLALLGIGLAALAAPTTRAGDASPLLDTKTPEDVTDLKALQEQVKTVLKKVQPCTVSVRVGGAQGSGVIINRKGHILTAGHVSGKPGQDVTVILHDGRKLRGKTLGANQDIDSGLIKITDEGRWPFVSMGDSAKLKKGQWCLAVGHPGGYKAGRSPVLRLGRVLDNTKRFVQTDCALVGGDSGGPLFDLQGKVIGIHSRIGKHMTVNLHVPVNTYRNTWSRLVKGELWGGRSSEGHKAYLGVKGSPDHADCKIAEIVSGSPADQAGLREGDVITKMDDEDIEDFEDLKSQIKDHKPGDRVTLEVRRGNRSLTVKVVLAKQED